MASDKESVIEMQHINPVGNNDSNTNELYEQQCVFSIADNEVKRIQHAVEIMIRFILTCIYEHTSFVESVFGENIVKHASFKSPLNIYYKFKDEHLLNVGSFYENTKNHFPDEFDFVCVIAECDESDCVSMKELTTKIADIFHDCLRDTVLKPLLAGTCIEFIELKGLHGPAAKLEFCYVNSSSDKKRIFVDISPASRVKMQGDLPNGMNIKHFEWKNGVVATGSLLLLKFFSAGHPKHYTMIKTSICEFEQFYMLNEMSEKHRRVYRLLKYLLNNESISEELQSIVRKKGNRATVVSARFVYPIVVYDFSSYVIKTLMFHHCLHCHMSVTTTSQCVTNVLDHLLNLFKTEENNKNSKPFSVSVETMTGENIEIADSYEPAMEIKTNLKQIRNDVFENRVTEANCLAQKMLPVVQQRMEYRETRKRCESNFTKNTSQCVATVLLSAMLFVLVMISVRKHQIRHCWNGTDYIRLNYSVSVYTNRSEYGLSNLSNALTFIQDNSPTILAIGETFCLEYNKIGQRGELFDRKMTNVSRIFYCGNHNSSSCLTKDNIYLIKVEKHDKKQQLVCRALEAEKGIHRITTTPTSSGSETGSELACFQNKTTCLDIKRKVYMFGYLLNEQALNCEDQQPCMQILSNKSKPLHCYISKQLKDTKNITQTEICCCEGYACNNPENDAEEKLAGDVLVICSIIVFFILWLIICCGCLFINARVQYCLYHLKRRFHHYQPNR